MGGPKHPTVGSQNALLQGRSYALERKKYRAEDERVMNEWDERKMRVAGEEHLIQRSFPISNNKHVALGFLNIIFESYEHRSKIILQLLTSFVFLKVDVVPHRRIYSWFKHITTVNC
jgi:TRAP-type mannitol/chloroaromatic compound transport system permease small subunit